MYHVRAQNFCRGNLAVDKLIICCLVSLPLLSDILPLSHLLDDDTADGGDDLSSLAPAAASVGLQRRLPLHHRDRRRPHPNPRHRAQVLLRLRALLAGPVE